MLKKILFFIIIIACFDGCTRDDICAAGTATTPQLIITFKDVSNPAVLKTVIGLSIVTDYDNAVQVLSRTDTDSIVLPLRTTSDTTQYRFIRTTIINTDTIVNIDKVSFTYLREAIYVNRACGYKTIFSELDAARENEGTANWILNFEILNTRVENENNAHITILH